LHAGAGLLLKFGEFRLAAIALSLIASGAGAAEQGLWEREKLTGDWGGARSALANRGVTVTLDYIGETLSVVRGGLRRGTAYEGRVDGIINTDLEKLFGWQGSSTHVRAFQIHKARQNAADLVGSIADPSNIDAVSTTRLFTAWFQQDFGKTGSIRVGQLAADDEFLTSTTAGGLINGTFGWATMLASNLPSGGAAYPLATPGARLQITLTESFSLLGGVFSGDPASRRCYDDNPDANPQVCNKHGTTFSFHGGTFWIGEAQYQVNQDKGATGLAAAYKVGAWYHTGNRFADQRFGVDGTGTLVSLANDPPLPFNHRENWGLYGVIDQMLWRGNGRSVSVFVRAGASPSDRNLVSRYVDGGIGLKGLFPGRPDDTLTLGVAHSKISKDAAALDLDILALDGPPFPIRSAETVFEASYIMQLAPWWSLQPDVQYIVKPGGNVPHPDDGSKTVGNALIVGARSTINF
jgi:porin